LIIQARKEIGGEGQDTKIELEASDQKKLLRLLKGLTCQQIRNIITRCFIDDHALNSKDLKAIEQFKKEIFDQGGMLEYCPTEELKNIANFDHLKKWVAQRRRAFSTRGQGALPPPKGVLLMGVQGCGKSLAAKVIANEFDLPLYRMDVSALYSPYIGKTEENIRGAFGTIDKLSPCCLWIDELEKAFCASDGQGDGGVSQRVLGMFLLFGLLRG